MRLVRFSRTLFSCPARTWTANHWARFSSSVIALTGGVGDGANDGLQDEFPQGDVTAQEEHGDDDDHRRIDKLLVLLHAFLLGIPRPGSFLEFDFHFGKQRRFG